MNTPKISIIIPLYNVEIYIQQCLESIVKQTLSDIEIILIDDCSTDRSIDIARKFASTDQRITILYQSHNSGQAEARNMGIKHATAPFIMFCDSDDFYDLQICEIMWRYITEQDVEMVVCGSHVIYDVDENFKKTDATYHAVKYSGTVPNSDAVLKKIDGCIWNKIFRRDILIDHEIWFPSGLKYEDICFLNMYACWVQNIHFTQEKLYHYRRRLGGTMNQTFTKKSNFSSDHLKVAFEFYRYLKQHNLYTQEKAIYWSDCCLEWLSFSLNYAQSPEEIQEIRQLAVNFITTEKPKYLSHRFVASLLCCAPAKQFFLGGMITIKSNPQKKDIKLLGISIWKVKFNASKIKYYLMGLPIYKSKAALKKWENE